MFFAVLGGFGVVRFGGFREFWGFEFLRMRPDALLFTRKSGSVCKWRRGKN